MMKLAMLALVIVVACDAPKERPAEQSVSHDRVVEYIGIPIGIPPAARQSAFDDRGTRMWCWEQRICNVPCLVCYTTTDNYTMSCNHVGGMLHCGGSTSAH